MIWLHLATEPRARPLPAFDRPLFGVVTFLAGFLLGVAVMWATDFVPPANP